MQPEPYEEPPVAIKGRSDRLFAGFPHWVVDKFAYTNNYQAAAESASDAENHLGMALLPVIDKGVFRHTLPAPEELDDLNQPSPPP